MSPEEAKREKLEGLAPRGSPTLLNYTWRAQNDLAWKGRPTKYLDYMGVELELDYNNALLRSDLIQQMSGDIPGLDNFIRAKHDSSVRGAEWVSAPATLAYHMSCPVWKKFFTWHEFWEANAGNNGLHVHISKENINALTAAKVSELVNKNQPLMKRIAGRDPGQWASFDSSRDILWVLGMQKGFRYNSIIPYESRSHQHIAINIASQHGTLEWRIFAATKDYNTFITRLQFVQAMVNFCRTTPLKHINMNGFSNWLLGTPPKKYTGRLRTYWKKEVE